MTTTPTVAAVIPTYETGALLLRTVDSLATQSRPPDEILIVDDGSETPEAEAALTAAAARPRVRVLHQAHNMGVAAARNRGIDESDTDFIVFLDSDDQFTTPTMEAYLRALGEQPDADFAYPTVQCFGGRTDVFPPPTFNAYLLHHVNICPIASMVTRRALESGVRFDPAIDVGHEDWDFWLRLVEAGSIGVAVPDATLLYRRIGFTRNDLGNQIEGGFDQMLRRLRPNVFDTTRLTQLKREWAPALTIRAVDAARTREMARCQTCDDFEVIAFDAPRASRGALVTLEWDTDEALLEDPFIVEDILGVPARHPGWEWIVHLRHSACREGTASGPLQTRDLIRGYVDPQDIIAITRRREDMLTGTTKDDATGRATFIDELRRLSIHAPQAIVWLRCAPWRWAPTEADPGAALQQDVMTSTAHRGWSREVLDTLPPALPWRRAAHGAGLYLGSRPRTPSTMEATLRVRDPFGGESLYRWEEDLLVGSEILGGGPLVHRTQVSGTVPLIRVLEHATSRRALTTSAPDSGYSPEAVVGYLDRQVIPGGDPLDAPGLGHTPLTVRLGWAFGMEDTHIKTAHLYGPVLNGRRWWRAVIPGSQRHIYGFDPFALERHGATVEGPVLLISVGHERRREDRPVYPLVDARGQTVGLTARATGHAGCTTGPPIGFVRSDPEGAEREIVLSRHEKTGSFLCSNLPGEGRDEGFTRIETVGYALC